MKLRDKKRGIYTIVTGPAKSDKAFAVNHLRQSAKELDADMLARHKKIATKRGWLNAGK